MIAGKAKWTRQMAPSRQNVIEQLRGSRATVDQIAKHDDVRNGVYCLGVAGDGSLDPQQQIEAPMDIADGINGADICGEFDPGSARRRSAGTILAADEARNPVH